MDKYEYKVRSEEIKNLIAEGQFAQAAEIADTIDWRRVKSVMMLCTIGDLYKINRRYEDAKNMLLLAYDRRPGGRTICYSLCELCIKTEEFVQAVNYYKEFVQAAPKDSGRYILQYKLYEAQDVSIEERIGVLEELKKRDYREKWAYELAYLYHKEGLAARCVEECDELILWFGEGRYVVKAMELKMLHEPLTPAQQEKYDHRFDKVEEPEEEIAEQEENGVRSQEGQWKAQRPVQGNGQRGPAEQSQESGQWELDSRYQGNEQWEADSQYQGNERWEADSRFQESVPWEADSQYQGNEQWEADSRFRESGQWGEESRAQGNGQWEADSQYQGNGQWETDGQYQGNEQWEAERQSQESGTWEPENRFEGNERWEEEAWGNYTQSADNPSPPADRWEPISNESGAGVETQQEELDIQVKTVDVSEYNTINLQAELAAGLQEVLGEDDNLQSPASSMPVPKTEEKRQENASETWESGVSAENGLEHEETMAVLETSEQENAVSEMSAFGQEEAEKAIEEKSREKSSSAVNSFEHQESRASGNMPNQDGDMSSREQSGDDEYTGKNAFVYENIPMEYVVEAEQDITVKDDTAEIVLAQMRMESASRAEKQAPSAEKIPKEPPKRLVEGLSQEEDGQVSMVVSESAVIEKQITGQMQIEDILAEWERTKKENEEKYKEEIRQQALRQTGPMFAEFEEAVRDGLLERLEKGEVIDIDAAARQELREDSRENGQAEYFEGTKAENTESRERTEGQERPESHRRSEGQEQPESHKQAEGQEQPESRRQPEGQEQPESHKQAEGQEQPESRRPPEGQEQPESHKQAEGQEQPESRRQPEGQEQPESHKQAEGQEQPEGRRRPEGQKQPESHRRPEGQELSENQSYAQVQESAENQTQEESRKPPEKHIQTKTDDKTGIEERQKEKEKKRAKASENTLTEAAQEPPIERETAKIRRLTREEKELYAPFIQSRSARERLVQAIDNISMAAYTGNIVVTGEEGMDTMTFAKNMIREVQMTDSNFSGKVAKISGQSLNQRNVEETLWSLNNGALIIYHASGMKPQTAAVLHKSLQQENLGIIVVLEDTKKAIQKMFLGTPELFGDFTARMDLEALSNDTLVSFGRRYAREMEYSIDDLGVLALHTRIEELQTIDHVVTVVEVKKIVDEAIRHACRKTLGHFFDILFAKRYDEEDMIILTEKDFA